MRAWLAGFAAHAEDVFCSYFGTKAIAATCVTILVKVFTNTHVVILMAFIALVLMDLATKQVALGAKWVAMQKGVDVSEVPTIDKIRGIAPAFRAKFIKSRLMVNGLCDKMSVYFVAVVCAKITDVVIVNTPDSFMLNLMYSYLGAVECLSILENMRDAGSKTVGRFVELAENKIMNKLK